ncbi:ABC transporter substrate-binding protein [Tatumella punctata]|uniref:ABC transporter substrate-binding protein n=1 Tax=Tatumella punctata TaxID=399969 RepID=A0ABW1VPZ6_9GAMM
MITLRAPGKRPALATLLLSLLAVSPYGATQTVTDDTGRQVTVADHATRIADGWFAHHSLLMTLGAGGRIVATVNHPQDRPWMFKIQPSLFQALQTPGHEFSSEALVLRHADVVFVPKNDPAAAGYRQAGIPVLMMNFDDFPSMERSLLTTAQVVGTRQARQRAEAYNRYLEQQIAVIRSKTDRLTLQQRPTVLHIQSLHPLKVDGRNTLIDTWITLAGGRNVAGNIEGNMKQITPEQVLAWQPDYIILDAAAGTLQQSPYQSLFSQLRAVKQQHVVRNPSGVFPWDRYGTETALQIQWAAQLLHPDLFPGINMVRQTRDFYQRFFDYPLTAAQAERILNAQPPE